MFYPWKWKCICDTQLFIEEKKIKWESKVKV